MTDRRVRAGRPRADDQARRGQRILDTAEQLLLRHGYHQVSLARIAREAGVAVRTIYTSLGGKAGLVAALVRREGARRMVEMEQIAALRCPARRLAHLAYHTLQLVLSEQRQQLQHCVVTLGDRQLAEQFYRAGAGQVLAMLEAQFAMADVRALCGEGWVPRALCDVFIGHVVGANVRAVLMPLSENMDQHMSLQRTDADVRSFLELVNGVTPETLTSRTMEAG